MSYTDISTPVIDKIRLPNYNSSTGDGEYYIADRELRNVVAGLSELVAGGVTFVIGWDGTSTPVVSDIPAGVDVYYAANVDDTPTKYTGTLTAANAQPGAFYLIKSITSPALAETNDTIDVYDEYVRIQTNANPATYAWEKIGDTQLNLTSVVTGASLTKETDTVIGSDATFTITQPIITLTANNATATGRKQYVEDITVTQKHLSSSTSVSSGSNDIVTNVVKAITSSSSNNDLLKGVSVSNGVLTFGAVSYSTDSVLGSDTTFSATTSNSLEDSSSSGSVEITAGVSSDTKYLSASASGANTAWNNKDSVTVLTNVTDVSVTKGSV